MKFNVSTKPLVNALNLGVINQNVSKFYQKSCLAQITATRRDLRINLEAEGIVSELSLRGSGDEDATYTIFVDCLLLKQLVSTFESNITTFEFVDGGLVLHAGNSRFTLSQMLDDSELELNAPTKVVPDNCSVIDIDKSNWKFIKDHQMYAIAMSFICPVYTRVWVGQDGDVIVGDFDNSLFTHSHKGNLGKTCLLPDTIVNLFNSLPDGAKLTNIGQSYLINVSTDGFMYTAEFKPLYESDAGVGEYNSEIILNMMNRDLSNAVKLDSEIIKKVLGQANLLSSSTEDSVTFEVGAENAILFNNNINCKMAVDNPTDPYKVDFKIATLSSVISNFDESTIYAAPMRDGEEISGVIFWTNTMTVVLGALDEE